MSGPGPEPEGPITGSLEKLRQELDHWLGIARDKGEQALGAFGLAGANPPVDIVETPDKVLVFADMPGVDPMSADVTLGGNMLTIAGRKPGLPTGKDHVVHGRERGEGEFRRSVPMPVPVDPEAVSAEARHGVLRIELNKAEQAKPHQIRVRTEEERPGTGGSPNPRSGNGSNTPE